LLGREDVRIYQVYLTNEKQLAPGSIHTAISALRFLYKVTLERDWTPEEFLPLPMKPQKLPIILSPDEVQRFLGCVLDLKHHAILTTCYAAGLRISEAVHLKTTDIDSQRMVVRVEQGKGQKDRYVMLSPKLLEILRDYWRMGRPKEWLFPGDRTGHPITRDAVGQACAKAHDLSLVQTGDAAQFAPRLRRSSPGGRHRRAHHSIAARSPQPRDHRPLSAHRHQQGLRYGEPLRALATSGAHPVAARQT
jgi:integrase/recombinase XerD